LILSLAGPSHEGSTASLCQAVARSRIHDKLPRRIIIWLQAGRLGAIIEPYLLMSFSRSGLADRTGSSATSLSGRFMYCVTNKNTQVRENELLGAANRCEVPASISAPEHWRKYLVSIPYGSDLVTCTSALPITHYAAIFFHTKTCTKACYAYLLLCCQHRLPVLGLSGLGPRRLAQQQVQEDVEERDQVVPGWPINRRTNKVS
jgi:hypothetical protein